MEHIAKECERERFPVCPEGRAQCRNYTPPTSSKPSNGFWSRRSFPPRKDRAMLSSEGGEEEITFAVEELNFAAQVDSCQDTLESISGILDIACTRTVV